MSWFKVDDRLWTHPKWLATPPAARGLWVSAGSWCAMNGSDGRVTVAILRVLGHSVGQARALVHSGLWREVDGGFEFHDWTEFQPLAAESQAKRAARAEAGRLGGIASGRSRREASASGLLEANLNPGPARPGPKAAARERAPEDDPLAPHQLTDIERAEFRRWLTEQRKANNPTGLIRHLASKGELTDAINDWKNARPKRLHPKLDPNSPQYDPSLAGAVARS